VTIIQEGNLEFTFGGSWRVLKYDDDGGYYRTILLKQFEAMKAIDFLGLQSREPLLMLDVKDYSCAPPDEERVPVAVAEKVRDTLAGIVGGSHTADAPEKGTFIDSYRKLSSPPRVIFFFEDLATPPRQLPQRKRDKRSVLFKDLKRYLRWLTPDVAVVGLDDYRNVVNDLTVRKVLRQ
jgi:hypothetical protein